MKDHLAGINARIKGLFINKKLFLIHDEDNRGMNLKYVLGNRQEFIDRLNTTRMIGLIQIGAAEQERKTPTEERQFFRLYFCFRHIETYSSRLQQKDFAGKAGGHLKASPRVPKPSALSVGIPCAAYWKYASGDDFLWPFRTHFLEAYMSLVNGLFLCVFHDMFQGSLRTPDK